MVGKAVTQQSSMPMRQSIQIKATGDKDTAKEVVPEEADTKDMAEEADASTADHTHHRSEISRDNWRILVRF